MLRIWGKDGGSDVHIRDSLPLKKEKEKEKGNLSLIICNGKELKRNKVLGPVAPLSPPSAGLYQKPVTAPV